VNHKLQGFAAKSGHFLQLFSGAVVVLVTYIKVLRVVNGQLPIEKVALVTGHKDWKMLRRYTNLKPEDLPQLQSSGQLDETSYIRTVTTVER